MNVEKRKLLTSLTALVCVAALLVGGTFAWRGVASALNEFGDEEITPPDPTDPGANLHDDFDAATGDKNFFVENTGDADVYVRVKLEEMFVDGINDPATGTWELFKPTDLTNSGAYHDGRTFVMSAVRNIVGARPALWISNK